MVPVCDGAGVTQAAATRQWPIVLPADTAATRIHCTMTLPAMPAPWWGSQ